MYAPDELHGINAMMPAFATENANSLGAKDTIDVDNLTAAVNRLIDDGVNVISTTGSYGECYALLYEEFQTLVKATLETVNDRVPVFVGITSQNGREAVRKAEFAREVGAQGVFVGVPHYYVPTVDNAIAFYREFCEMFPDLSVQLYHNPTLHRIHIPVAAFNEIASNPNIVSMKDSHRTPMEFMALQKIIRNKISVFTYQLQYFPYAQWGAAGFWSTDVWMGPWPLLRLRDLVDAGRFEEAEELIFEIGGGVPMTSGDGEIKPNDNARKIAASLSGYCNQGPNRSPYSVVPAESLDRSIKRVERWKAMAEKYRTMEPVAGLVSAR